MTRRVFPCPENAYAPRCFGLLGDWDLQSQKLNYYVVYCWLSANGKSKYLVSVSMLPGQTWARETL